MVYITKVSNFPKTILVLSCIAFAGLMFIYAVTYVLPAKLIVVSYIAIVSLLVFLLIPQLSMKVCEVEITGDHIKVTLPEKNITIELSNVLKYTFGATFILKNFSIYTKNGSLLGCLFQYNWFLNKNDEFMAMKAAVVAAIDQYQQKHPVDPALPEYPDVPQAEKRERLLNLFTPMIGFPAIYMLTGLAFMQIFFPEDTFFRQWKMVSGSSGAVVIVLIIYSRIAVKKQENTRGH